MAVKIRLKRIGAKKKPFYRIVVADSRSPRDGRFIEELGYYDPLKEPSEIRVDVEKANSWIAKGAQPTDTVKSLLKRAGAFDVSTSVANATDASGTVSAPSTASATDADSGVGADSASGADAANAADAASATDAVDAADAFDAAE